MDGNRQSKLPYKREDRLAALAAIDRSKFAQKLTQQTWSNVIELLTQIELCTGREGCFAYTETLAARMFNGVSRAKFFRVAKLARELDLLDSKDRYNKQGQQSNEWSVRWDHIMVLAARDDVRLTAQKVRPTRRKLRPTPSQTETGGSQIETPLIRNNLSSVSPVVFSLGSTDDRVSVSQRLTQRTLRRPSVWDWEAARATAETIETKIGRCRAAGDRSLVLKASALRQKFGEHWLWDSVEAVLRSDNANRFAYLHACLAEKCQALGVVFNRELAAIVVPPDLLGQIEPSDLNERLCGAEPERIVS